LLALAFGSQCISCSFFDSFEAINSPDVIKGLEGMGFSISLKK
jgi:hypothetical protein